MGSVGPDGEENGPFEQERIHVRRDTESMQKSLQHVAHEERVEVLAFFPSNLQEACFDRRSNVARFLVLRTRHVTAST